MIIDMKDNKNWLEHVSENLQKIGCVVVSGVMDSAYLSEAHDRMYKVQEKILLDIGKDRLSRAGEIGVLRLMMKYDPFFLKFVEIPEVQAIVNKTLSETAIMHLQNGFINPTLITDVTDVFQYQFHRDFPRVLNGHVASMNILIAVTDFTRTNGATMVVPGSHQNLNKPSDEEMQMNAIPLECPAGSLVLFDSTLWHAAGKNSSGGDRLGINHQFTSSFIKQQIDYVRALGNKFIEAQQPKIQQLLGYYTRMVTSLDEYYLPENERLYRRGQG